MTSSLRPFAVSAKLMVHSDLVLWINRTHPHPYSTVSYPIDEPPNCKPRIVCPNTVEIGPLPASHELWNENGLER